MFLRSFMTFQDPTMCTVVVVGGDYIKKIENVTRKVEEIGDTMDRVPEAVFIFPESGSCSDEVEVTCGYIQGHNEGGEYHDRSVQECQSLCCSDPRCRSFESRQSRGLNCALSFHTKSDALIGRSYKETSCGDTDWKYHELKRSQGGITGGGKYSSKRIANIDGSWGPFFTVDFDLFIHSHVQTKRASVLAFEKTWWDPQGYPWYQAQVPQIHVDKRGFLRFTYSDEAASIKRVHKFKVELKKWYNIHIEQMRYKDKVMRSEIFFLKS